MEGEAGLLGVVGTDDVAAHEEGAQEFDDGGDDDGLAQREHLRAH